MVAKMTSVIGIFVASTQARSGAHNNTISWRERSKPPSEHGTIPVNADCGKLALKETKLHAIRRSWDASSYPKARSTTGKRSAGWGCAFETDGDNCPDAIVR